jgi:hypothetical protein
MDVTPFFFSLKSNKTYDQTGKKIEILDSISCKEKITACLTIGAFVSRNPYFAL